MNPTPLDRLLVQLHRLLPARLLAKLVYALSRSRRGWLKNALIRGFSRMYGVDTAEAALPCPEGYASFNEFFTRELRPGARHFALDSAAVLCPADGTVAQTGHANAGRLLQAKGKYFTAADLLGSAEFSAALADAPFATIYLAPYNYHRVHMPITGTLRRTRFIPGRLYSVNARTTAVIDRLYAVNERLVCEFDTSHGPLGIVLVGAMNVASISTAWGGEVLPPADGTVVETDCSSLGVQLNQGDYLGHFNMGSTVVLIGPPLTCNWQDGIAPGTRVRVGQTLGRFAA